MTNDQIIVGRSGTGFIFSNLNLKKKINFDIYAGQYLSECERHAEAAEQYVRAASLAPSEYEIVFNAANTLRQAGRHSEAEQYYRSAVRIRPLVIDFFLEFISIDSNPKS